MNSRFYYPTNTGSLGETRRASSFMSQVEQRPSARFEADHRARTNLAKPTILVVEDDDNSLFILKRILETKGYRVLAAFDGQQAVDIAEAEKLDLILLDLQLPRLDGFGVIHLLRENTNLESLPVVIMTGLDRENYRGKAIAAGCDDFLIKPIDFDRLDAVLDYFVPLQDAS